MHSWGWAGLRMCGESPNACRYIASRPVKCESDVIISSFSVMAEIPLPVSKAREELVSWRQSAYEARREAAIKIQRWYREGYRIAASCVNPESPSEAERAAGGRYDIKGTP